MKNISIKINFESFNNEYHAEIWLDHNKSRYLGSDNLNKLLSEIKRVVLKEKVD